MKQRKSTLQIVFHCLLVLLVSASANALNLGDINLKSAPDQPLEAEIQLLGVAADEQDRLSVGLADVAGFRWAGIEWSPVLNQLQFELKRGADGTDYIRIHSSEVVQAPLLHFLLKVAWSRGRLFREYTVELDTPLYLLPASSRQKLFHNPPLLLPLNVTGTRSGQLSGQPAIMGRLLNMTPYGRLPASCARILPSRYNR